MAGCISGGFPMKRILLCLSLTLFVSIAGLGQGTTSRIAGVVTDSSGAVVPNVPVTAIQESTHATYNTVTGSKGEYVFDSLQIGKYTIRVTSPSFKTFVSTGNVLSIGLPTTVNAVLSVGSADQTVEVQGGYNLVQTESSGNFGGIIDNVTLTQLPIVGTRGRNPLGLVTLIPGVVNNGGNATGGGVSVNGSRDRAWNYMLDGVDINETSAGGANNSPVHLNPDMLSEFRVITSNFTPEYGRNSGGQIVMVTRSGSNSFHGNLFEFYQSPFLRANTPEAKAAGLPRGQFVQHIYGGSLGGPIIKDKLFFFVNVELLHALQSSVVTRSVYTATAKQGLFRYATKPGTRNNPAGSDSENGGPSVDTNGNPIVDYATYNMVANDPFHVGLDPTVQQFLALAPLPNNFKTGDGLNFAGYTFSAPATDKQVDTTYKIDYIINQHNSIFGRWYSGHQNTFADAVNGGLQTFPGAPAVVNTFRQPRNLALGYRAAITPSITNEFLLGMNRFGYAFVNPAIDTAIKTPYNFSLVDAPRNAYLSNNRYLTTYQLVDNFTWVKNAHTIKAGINFRYGRQIDHRGSIGSLDAIPQVDFSTGSNPLDPGKYNVPTTNIDTTNDAPNLATATNELLGRIGNVTAGYVSNSTGSAFKPTGSINIMDHRWPEYDFYIQDSWKILPNLVIDYGLRLDARMAPRFKSAPPLVPNVSLDYGENAGAAISFVPGKYYNDDWNNLGPSVGFAWDPYKTGKTSVRGNFRIAYDRINSFSFSSSVFQGMPGLTYQLTDATSGRDNFTTNTEGRRAQNWVAPVPNTTPNDLRTPPQYGPGSLTVADPHMKTPAVAMWGLSVQQELAKDTVLTITYVGNHGTALYGGYNSNQTEIMSNGFLQAFQTVQAGGDSPLMDKIVSSDTRRKPGQNGTDFLKSQTTYKGYLNLDNVGALANALATRLQNPTPDNPNGTPLVVTSGLPATFFKPYSQYLGGLNVLQTRDYSRYNGLQIQIEKRFSKGMLFQANYVWSKTEDVRSFDPTFTTVATGSSQSAAATPFDYRHPRLNYAPADYDNTSTVAGNFVYDLPFGRGKWIGSNWNRAVDTLIGGWEIAGDGNWYSGRPITFFSGSNTFSATVQTPASCDSCNPKMGHIHADPETGILTYFTPEQKAKLYRPKAGQFSNLGRNYFRQAAVWNVDATLSKNFTTYHEQFLQLRLEAQNLANNVSYDTFGSQSIQSSVFGRLNPATDGVVSNGPRRMQLSAKYVF
jgi:hypothetical protein